jgi:hypothetical protein
MGGNDILMSFSDKVTSIKNRKRAIYDFLDSSVYNHPNRLSEVGLSGSMYLIKDGRDYTVYPYNPTFSREVKEYTIDFSLATHYIRSYFEKEPTPNYLPDATDLGTFHLGHFPNQWFIQSHNLSPASVVVGTKTITEYSRASVSDPWIAGSVTSSDITMYFEMTILGGGDPVSKGKGTGGDDNKAVIYFHPVINVYAELPDFGAYSGEIKRLPWDASWSSETAMFIPIFSNYLDFNNAFYGGGFSGNCSLSLNFTIP